MKKIIFYLILFTNLTLLGAQLWLSISKATTGSEVVTLRTQINDLKSQNKKLELEIYSQSSLANIQSKSISHELSSITPQFVPSSIPLAQAVVMP